MGDSQCGKDTALLIELRTPCYRNCLKYQRSSFTWSLKRSFRPKEYRELTTVESKIELDARQRAPLGREYPKLKSKVTAPALMVSIGCTWRSTIKCGATQFLAVP